jgi:hypothetical protein
MSWGAMFRSGWEHASPGNRAAAREAAAHPDQAASLMSSAIAHTLQRVQYAAQDLQRLCTAADPAFDTTAQAPSALRQAMDDIRQGRIPPERSEKHLRQAAADAVTRSQSNAGPQGTGSIQDTDTKAMQEKLRAMQRFCDLKCRLLEQVAEVEGPMEIAAAEEADRPRSQPNPHPNLALAARVRAVFGAIDNAFIEYKRADDPAVPLPPTRELTTGGSEKCHPPHA